MRFPLVREAASKVDSIASIRMFASLSVRGVHVESTFLKVPRGTAFVLFATGV